MTFVPSAADIAADAMEKIAPALVDRYVAVIKFLMQYPDAASKPRGSSAPPVGSEEYVRLQASAFAEARHPRAPKEPETIPDEMVSVILNEYFGVETVDLERVKREHQLSMGAENLVGDVLERYLAETMEASGWVWCSGSMVRAVDFVKPPTTQRGEWRMLQVKNRDNSENSSSSAIREGTAIEKWHRTFSKKRGANWAAFPDTALRSNFSEEKFEAFVRSYLRNLRR